jgi:hypothetical protein
MPPRSNNRQREVAGEQHTARGRIAAAAAEHGWLPAVGTDEVWNTRIYERGNKQLLVGYRFAGSVTSAFRRTAPHGSWTDDLTHRDRGKAEQVLAWLAEG